MVTDIVAGAALVAMAGDATIAGWSTIAESGLLLSVNPRRYIVMEVIWRLQGGVSCMP